MAGFEEVCIVKDMTIKSEDVQSKRVSLVPSVFLIFAAMITLTLTYALIVPGESANAHYFSSNGEQAAKQKILDWMAENSAMPDNVLSKIYNAAAITGNRDLILAICLVESNFNPHVESDKGAIGLMGIMPGVWLKELKEQGIIREKEDLYKISGNIAAGAHVLATYLSETNDLRQALIRYVGGASWYATRVLQAQKQIRLAQYADQQLALSSLQN
jgi:soluble lytic murein transglycosylase-like protein